MVLRVLASFESMGDDEEKKLFFFPLSLYLCSRRPPSDLYSSSRGPAAADAITVTSAVIGRGLEKGSKSWCRRCGMALLRRRCLVAAAAV